MIDLARRSGHIQSIYAHAVHENDEFEYELGLHLNWSISRHMEIVVRLLVRMQSLILKTAGIKWSSCRKVKLRNAGNVPLPLILAIALGVATMKKWRKLWFVTCLNTYRLA